MQILLRISENEKNKAYGKNVALWTIWGSYETNCSQQMGVKFLS